MVHADVNITFGNLLELDGYINPWVLSYAANRYPQIAFVCLCVRRARCPGNGIIAPLADRVYVAKDKSLKDVKRVVILLFQPDRRINKKLPDTLSLKFNHFT